MEKVLSELTMPASQSAVGKEGRRMTTEFERKVLKEVQRYEHRIYQEMDPETAEQLQQNENEVSRLRDTLSGLRKQIDSEKGMQERILREFRASFGDSGSGSKSGSHVRRSGSGSLAAAARTEKY
jgi:TolA-binding protein